MIIKENIDITNFGPNKEELTNCKKFGENNSNILISTFETLYKSKDYIDSRLNNLSSRILN